LCVGFFPLNERYYITNKTVCQPFFESFFIFFKKVLLP